MMIAPKTSVIVPLSGGGDDRPDRGERAALHDRQPGADLPHADARQRRGDAGREDVGGDQDRHVGGRDLERGADDERDGDRARVHAEHVLQAEGSELLRREDLVDRRDGLGGGASLVMRALHRACERMRRAAE